MPIPIIVGERNTFKNERMSRFGDALQQALKEADCFVFECDTASQEAQAVIAEMMAAEQPLGEVLSAET